MGPQELMQMHIAHFVMQPVMVLLMLLQRQRFLHNQVGQHVPVQTHANI